MNIRVEFGYPCSNQGRMPVTTHVLPREAERRRPVTLRQVGHGCAHWGSAQACIGSQEGLAAYALAALRGATPRNARRVLVPAPHALLTLPRQQGWRGRTKLLQRIMILRRGSGKCYWQKRRPPPSTADRRQGLLRDTAKPTCKCTAARLGKQSPKHCPHSPMRTTGATVAALSCRACTPLSSRVARS